MASTAAVPEELLTVVRVPLANLEADLRSKYRLSDPLFDVKVDAEAVVFSFRRADPTGGPPPIARAAAAPAPVTRTRRRRSSKRNRMKTKGWGIAAKIKNAAGQTAVIYQPFVDALANKELTMTQKKKVVADILKSNGNRPNDASIDYYLQNTLEYLADGKVT
jgi:hypothetical protein